MTHTLTGALAQSGPRPADYYDCARPEVAALVPPACRRILDVGCGCGQLGRLLGQRGHHVTGLELDPAAAEAACDHLDAVIRGDVETGGLPPGPFDAIVFADILEHLVDPWRVLREAVNVLAPEGVIVASIPNVQNWDVLWRLVRGRWDYRDRGLLDRGHLRFFTLRSIRELFVQAGLKVVHVGHRYRRSLWREALCLATAGWARGLFTRQYLIVGRRSGSVTATPRYADFESSDRSSDRGPGC